MSHSSLLVTTARSARRLWGVSLLRGAAVVVGAFLIVDAAVTFTVAATPSGLGSREAPRPGAPSDPAKFKLGADLVLESNADAAQRVLDETDGYGADAFDLVGVQPTVDLEANKVTGRAILVP